MYTHAVIAISHMILSTVIAALTAATVMVTPHHETVSAAWAHEVVTKAIEIGPHVWLVIAFIAFGVALVNIKSDSAIKTVKYDPEKTGSSIASARKDS